jgi:hypothetical protein
MKIEVFNKPVMLIEVPYGGVQLQLEPGPFRHRDESLEWLTHSSFEECPRILTAAVLLWHAGAGDFGACLSTAIVWERG